MSQRIYDVGDTARLWARYYSDKDGTTPADPTSVKLLLKVPTGGTESELTPLVHVAGTGYYYYLYTTTNDPGEHSYRFVGDGAVTQCGEKSFMVRETKFTAPL